MARNKSKRKQYVNPNQGKTNTGEMNEFGEYVDADGDETLVDIVEAKEVAQDFFEKNQNMILGLIVGGVLLLGAYLAYSFGYKAPQEAAAMEAIYKAQEQFAQDSFILALENPGGGFEGFLDIIDNYGGTKAGNLSKYYAGISYLNLGRFEDAISYLESYSANDEITPIMKSGALGDAYADQDTPDYDKALGLYKTAANSEDNDFLTPYYLYKYGILAKVQGKDAEAKAAFERIKNEYPESNEAGEAERYATMLN